MKKNKELPITAGRGAAPHYRDPVRIVGGGYVADIICDHQADPPVFHWIVQRAHSAEILQWGQEWTPEEAEASAREALRPLAGRARGSSAG